ELCQSEKGLLNSSDQERLMDKVMDETFGLGPLESLLKDPAVTDILVNKFDRIYAERRGRLELSDIRFRDNAHLRQIIDRIVALVGRRIDEVSPMADARLADGSRVNAIIPPLALDGPAMSIRRFGHKPLQLEDVIRHSAFPACVMDFLAASGHATVHANSPRDALGRIKVMVAMAGYDLPIRALRQQISSAINIIVQSARLTGGKRKVTKVSEITGMEGDQIQVQDIFAFEQTGVDSNGMA